MERELTCGACNMAFRSAGLLEKHQALFCIGSEVGDPRAQTRGSVEAVARNGGRGADPELTRTPELVQVRGQRRNVTRWRSVDAGPESGGRAGDKAASGRADGAALQNLTDEMESKLHSQEDQPGSQEHGLKFHRLRMSIAENLPLWSQRSTDSEASGRHLGHGERLREMREMATLHEHQLALIHARNQQLEQQRDELALQVSVLSEQNNASQLESLLMELRDQEERNEETLQQLAEHLRALHEPKVSVPADQPDPGRNKNIHHDNCELVPSVDGPLSTQIIALRRAYVQSGGSDPAIVAQMIDLQAEAQSLEKNQAAASAKARKKKVTRPQRGPSWELLVLEQENQRLEEEILRIQLARGRNRDYEALRTELELIQRENLQHISSSQAEMERSKEAPGPCRQPPPPPPHPHPLQTKTHVHAPLSMLQARSSTSPSERCMMDPLDCLGPAPYDPVAGFVVFFDLALGVDASQKALRLVAALYSEGLEAGPPTPLPPVRCLPGGSLPYGLGHGNFALLSVKQPVPRVQPSPSLCLVVEVQAATDLDVYSPEAFKLASCGWTRLELFDRHNQLRSGHWRVPVRSLPIRPSLSVAQLNSTPQVGNAELCVRLVNGRDGDAQTLAKPDPTSTRHYKYPAVVSSPPVSAPQPTGGDHLSPPMTSTDHKNPLTGFVCEQS